MGISAWQLTTFFPTCSWFTMIQSHIHQRHDMHLWSKNSEETIHHVSQIPTASKKHLDPFLQAIFGLEDSRRFYIKPTNTVNTVWPHKSGVDTLEKLQEVAGNLRVFHPNATPPQEMACLILLEDHDGLSPWIRRGSIPLDFQWALKSTRNVRKLT